MPPKSKPIYAAIETMVESESTSYVVHERYDFHESGETNFTTLFDTYDQAKVYLVSLL